MTLIQELRNYVADGDTRFGALRERASLRIAVLEQEIGRLQQEVARLKAENERLKKPPNRGFASSDSNFDAD